LENIILLLRRIAATGWEHAQAETALISVELADEPPLYSTLVSGGYKLDIPRRVRIGPLAVSVGSLNARAAVDSADALDGCLLAVAQLDTGLDPFDVCVKLRGPSQVELVLKLNPRLCTIGVAVSGTPAVEAIQSLVRDRLNEAAAAGRMIITEY
jgi:hypothetical protein